LNKKPNKEVETVPNVVNFPKIQTADLSVPEPNNLITHIPDLSPTSFL
jgi:hypothetical protein